MDWPSPQAAAAPFICKAWSGDLMIAKRLIISLVLSLLGSALFTFWLSKKFAKSKPEPPKTQQYVATAASVQAGDVLSATNLKIVEWPASSPLEGAFAKPEQIIGRTVIYPLAAGEPILDRQLTAPGAGIGLTTKIPEGMRAISLRSDQVVGVAGFLLPGTRVDVLVTYHVQGSPNPITTTVLQDAQILAAGQKMQADADTKATATDVVTLLVTPVDAERVVLASAQGSVHFVLRNGSDHQKIADIPTQVSSIGDFIAPTQSAPAVQRDLNLQQKPTQPEHKGYQVLTIYGNKQVMETVQ
jgi:pilus assembly protein CpaB